MKILLVDDEKSVADSVAEMLRTASYSVDVAYSYGHAISFINNSYDMLLIDYMLNDIKNGAEYAKEYKDKHPKALICVYTAKSDLKNIRDLSVADNVIEKPIFLDELLNIIKRLSSEEFKQDARINMEQAIIRNGILDMKDNIKDFDKRLTSVEQLVRTEIPEMHTEISKTLSKLEILNTKNKDEMSSFVTKHANDAVRIILWLLGAIVALYFLNKMPG